MSRREKIIYFNGQCDHPAAPQVRKSIAMKHQAIGRAVVNGSSDIAIRQLVQDLRDYEQLNAKFLRPTWPLPPGYRIRV